MRVAGLASVNVAGIENIDVTEDVPGHMAYRGMMPTLLDKVGWAMESLEYTEIEDPDPENHERRQRELLDEIEEARKQLDEQPEKKGFKAFFSRKKAPQKKSWETYDERSQKILEGDEKESEKAAQESANVLFDVDAIRKEALALAVQSPGDIEEIKKHLSVKEIQSTLPALKVSLPKEEEEAKKANGSTTPNGSSRPEPRHTQSHDGVSSTSQSQPSGPASSSTSLPNGSHKEQEEGDISMSFEDDDPRPKTAHAPEPTSWSDQPKYRFGASSEHLPTMRSVSSPMPSSQRTGQQSSLRNPWGADADDEEWGKEREVKMDFE